MLALPPDVADGGQRDDEGGKLRDREPHLRHPSQLYQFALEGIVLFAFLWWYARKPRPTGAVSGAFLVGYGVVRFIAEFARQSDDFLGLLAFQLSMGQWLSLPMIAIGAAMMLWAYRRPTAAGGSAAR